MNPYTVGTPVCGIQFYNRIKILEELNAFDKKHYFLNGIRRIGKTSILLQLAQNLFIEGNYIPVYFSFQGHPTNSEMGHHLRIKIKQSLDESNLEPFGWNVRASSIEDALEDWINYCRSNKIKSFLLFDEVEQLHELSDETISKITALFSDATDCLKIIMAGTRKFFQMNNRSDLIAFSNLFRSRYVGHIDFNDIKDIVCQLQEPISGRVSVLNEQIENIYSYCGGHPYLIQFICDDHFDLRNRTLKAEASNRISSNEQLDNCFKDDFDYLNENQQKILLFLANQEQASQIEISENSGLSDRIINQEIKELNYLGFLKVIDDKYLIRYLLFKDWLKDKSTPPKKTNNQNTKLKIVTLFAPDAHEYLIDMKKQCFDLLHLHFEHWDVENLIVGNIEIAVAQKIDEADIVIGLLSSDFFEPGSQTEKHFRRFKPSDRFVPILATVFPHDLCIDPKAFNILPRMDAVEHPLQKWEYRGDAYRQISEKLLAIKKNITDNNSNQ